MNKNVSILIFVAVLFALLLVLPIIGIPDNLALKYKSAVLFRYVFVLWFLIIAFVAYWMNRKRKRP